MSNSKRRSFMIAAVFAAMIMNPTLASAESASQDAPTGGAQAPTQTLASEQADTPASTPHTQRGERQSRLRASCSRAYTHRQFRPFAKRVYRGRGVSTTRKRHVRYVLRCHTSRGGRADSRRMIHRLQRLQWRRNHPWLMRWQRIPARGKQWVLRTASCESGRNPGVVSSNGLYFGAMQFSSSTWHSVGGRGSPAAASLKEQYVRGYRLMQRDGAGHWPVCG